MTYVEINSKWFEENKKKAEEISKGALGDDWKGELQFNIADMPELNKASIEIEEISDDGIIKFSVTNDLGYFGFDIPLDDDDLVRLVSVITKKMNKFKSIMESLK